MRKRGLAERERRGGGGGVVKEPLFSLRSSVSCRLALLWRVDGIACQVFPTAFPVRRRESCWPCGWAERKESWCTIKCPCASGPQLPVTPSPLHQPSGKWHKAAVVISWFPSQRSCGQCWMSNNTGLPLSLPSSVFLGPLVPSHPCGSIIAFLVLFNFRISTLKGGSFAKAVHYPVVCVCVYVCVRQCLSTRVLCQFEQSSTFLTMQVRPASWLTPSTCMHGLNKRSFGFNKPACILKYAYNLALFSWSHSTPT